MDAETAKPKNQFPPLTAVEVARIAGELQSLVGAQLQECLQTAAELGLGFYHERETLWLWFDLEPLRPVVVRMKGKPPPRKKLQRPFTLFVRSRFLGRRLQSVRADLTRGRLLVFNFHRAQDEEEQGSCEIEVRLFPHGQNVIARDGKKAVAENKPKDLPTVQTHADASEGRSWEEIEGQWHARQSMSRKPSSVANAHINEAAKLEKEWKRAIEKKEKGIERMREELQEKMNPVYSRLGEWLKANGTMELPLDVPDEWRSLVDSEKSLSWNIENCFHRAKENARKSEGTRARLALVENELTHLRAKGPASFAKRREQEDKKEGENLLVRADARGRRHKLGDDLEVYVGKSAADNLALLRRAQPFDYWLHLREQPGSHAILRRTRTRNVTDQEFLEAGKWVIEQSLNKRVSELKGERFDLLIVESRFVRPIKGDKLGRVNYTNDRVMTIRL